MSQYIQLSEENEKILMQALISKVAEELTLARQQLDDEKKRQVALNCLYKSHLTMANAVNLAQFMVFVVLFARFVWPMI